MIGIISENDVLKAYLQISEEINQVEKDWILILIKLKYNPSVKNIEYVNK
jgi:hypothetical protein